MAVSSCRLPEHGKVCFKSVKGMENKQIKMLSREQTVCRKYKTK